MPPPRLASPRRASPRLAAQVSRAEVSPLRCREQSAPTAAPPPCVRSKSAPAELQLPPDHPPAQPALGCIKRRYAFFVGLAVGVLAPVSSVSYIWRAELSAGVSLGVGHVTNLTNRTFGDLANITWPSESYEQMVRLIPQRTWLGTEFGLSVEDLLEMLPVRSAAQVLAGRARGGVRGRVRDRGRVKGRGRNPNPNPHPHPKPQQEAAVEETQQRPGLMAWAEGRRAHHPVVLG